MTQERAQAHAAGQDLNYIALSGALWGSGETDRAPSFAANLLDGGVPWYGVYECADGEWMTIGALEPKFWDTLLQLLDIDPDSFGDRSNRDDRPAMRAGFTEIFKSKPREHWCALLEGTDACFAPVLSPAEARAHPHNAARHIFTAEGPERPMPAPRFRAAQTPLPDPAPKPGADTRAVLAEIGFDDTRLDDLFGAGVVA